MTKKPYALIGLFNLFSALPAFAENIVVIEQVGAGKAIVKQSGNNNSVRITQTPEESQNNDAPYLSVGERARATSIIDSSEKPQDTANKNTIDIQQDGKNNKATISQSGDDNNLLLHQKGKNNNYKKYQEGKHNKAKVIQNSEIIESDDDYPTIH